MAIPTSKLASQLRNFIASNHIYADDISEEIVERIRNAAENDTEENMSSGITIRRGKPRRSTVPQFPGEWSSSREPFQRAAHRFETKINLQSPGKLSAAGPTRNTPKPPSHNPHMRQNSPSGTSPTLQRRRILNNINTVTSPHDFGMSLIPREVTSLFDRVDKLDEYNWAT